MKEGEYDKYLEKQKALIAKFPILFPDGKEPVCGFSCWLGWFPLLDKLCTDLENIIKNSGLPLEDASFRAEQVKEKFGTLRFYISGAHELIHEAVYERINQAEIESSRTCEHCGEPGKLDNSFGWIKTYCEKCKKGKK
jgi:hypothetical protein